MMCRTFLLILLLLSCAWGQQGWKTDSNIIFLHRGARAVAPEGSIEAVSEAIRQGADGIEVDLRLTLDGHVINFHNKDTLVKGFGLLPVERMTLDEVRAMDMGSWFSARHRGARVATFEEILRLALPNDLYLRVELKKPEVREAVEELMDRYDAWRLLGSSVDGTFQKREVLSMPFLAKDLWMTGGEDDRSVLRKLMKAHGKEPFRVNVDDCRIFSQVLRRSPALRKLHEAIPRRQTATSSPPRSIDSLMTMLKGEDQMDAWRAATELARRGAHTQIDLALNRKPIGPFAAEAAAFALASLQCSENERSQLMDQALLLRLPSVTRMIAYTIGRRKMTAKLPILRRLATDGAAIRIRTAAFWSLGEMDDVKSAAMLRRVADDGGADVQMRIQAVIAIGKLRDLGGRGAVVSALEKGPPPVSLLAVETLGLLGQGESAALLGRLLGKARETKLKVWAIIALCNALAGMGPKGQGILLVHAGADDSIVRREALYALARTGSAVVDSAEKADLPGELVSRLKWLTR